ncbi:hypothetical protein J6590_108746 [Homalodisca vitripennis]|nr:hypothetical protein J6590_108746 [Homalodisca vitripennis]
MGKNPHTTMQSRYEQNFSSNVWILNIHIITNFVIGDVLTGPLVLPQNGESYLNFIQNKLFELLEDLPATTRHRMWCMHDGAPPCFSVNVRALFNKQFGNKWIGRRGPVAWPHR